MSNLILFVVFVGFTSFFAGATTSALLGIYGVVLLLSFLRPIHP